jgi:hypothetical protein
MAIPNPFNLDLVHTYEFLQKYLLDPKDLLLDDALAYLCGNASIDICCVSHMSGSESVPSESRFKRSCGACLSPPYASNWLISKPRRLAILRDSI